MFFCDDYKSTKVDTIKLLRKKKNIWKKAIGRALHMSKTELLADERMYYKTKESFLHEFASAPSNLCKTVSVIDTTLSFRPRLFLRKKISTRNRQRMRTYRTLGGKDVSRRICGSLFKCNSSDVSDTSAIPQRRCTRVERHPSHDSCGSCVA